MIGSIVILTGLSGSGKTTALKSFEDLSYYTIDNLPVSVLIDTVEVFSNSNDANKLVLAINSRTRGIGEFYYILSTLKSLYTVNVVFLEASKDVLIRRYKETRHLHPLGISLDDAIDKEISILSSVKSFSNVVIDTSNSNIHELSQTIHDMFNKGNMKFTVLLQSFGFKVGLPVDSDLVFDVRFLRNPYFDSQLKEKTGLDEEVGKYIEEDENFSTFMDDLQRMLGNLIPKYSKGNRMFVAISVGCTGGKHRSVYVVEKLSEYLSSKFDYIFLIKHIDMGK